MFTKIVEKLWLTQNFHKTRNFTAAVLTCLPKFCRVFKPNIFYWLFKKNFVCDKNKIIALFVKEFRPILFCVDYTANLSSITTTLQLTKQSTRRLHLRWWATTRLSSCRYWLSTAGFWCRGRSPGVQCRSTRTGRHIVMGLEQPQATTTTGWDLTGSTVCCSLATPDSKSRCLAVATFLQDEGLFTA